jgi:hypothetical protein
MVRRQQTLKIDHVPAQLPPIRPHHPSFRHRDSPPRISDERITAQTKTPIPSHARHAGYAVSRRIRKRIEEAFGWMKTIGGQEKTKFRGRDRVGWAFIFTAAAYNWRGCPTAGCRYERAGADELQTYRPLADRWGRHLGSRLSRRLRARHDHRPWPRRNRLRRAPSRLDIEYSRSSVGVTWEGSTKWTKP